MSRNTFGAGLKSPMAACSGHAMLGGREGRTTNGFRLDWKQRGRDKCEQLITDGGAEANRLWELKNGNKL